MLWPHIEEEMMQEKRVFEMFLRQVALIHENTLGIEDFDEAHLVVERESVS